ncbi:MAG TPA: hypothetical protein VMV32_12310 [Ignavibacteriaceae bacterium]|nr:hypothetical protein [Ignavibacteriaceae bacterium]
MIDEEISEEMKRVIGIITEKKPEILKGLYAVGDWLWLEFDCIPEQDIRDVIRGLGFHWNRKRKLWQCSCGVYSRPSDDDPRPKYGVSRFN